MDWTITRDHCGPWTPILVTLYILANSAIFLAYLVIAAQLFITVKVGGLFKSWPGLIKVLFGLFIFSCGVGHLLDGVLPFFWPYYPLFTAWHILTAVLSVTTAAVFPRMVIQVLLDKNKGNQHHDGGKQTK